VSYGEEHTSGSSRVFFPHFFMVVGDSMFPLIHDGEWLIVDPSRPAHDGDVVAVHITGWEREDGTVVSGFVVKRLAEGGTVLESENPAFPPMVLRPEHQARVVGVVMNTGQIL
jgi:SOS-response transcriptional repressor LexA